MPKVIEAIPGKSGHGGNIHLLSRKNKDKAPVVDFSANINPLGPPPWLRSVVSRNLEEIIHYPDPECHDLINSIADFYKVSLDEVVPANGTTEILYLLPAALPCRRAVIPVPSYIDYQKVMELHDIEVVLVELSARSNFQPNLEELSEVLQPGDLLILGSPNNPTATIIDAEQLIAFARRHSDIWLVVDEAFLDFVNHSMSVAAQAENIITLHSLTKFYAIPGLRLGFGIFPREIADRLRSKMPPWSVNTLSQAVGTRLFADTGYREKSILAVKTLRENLVAQLQKIPQLYVFPATANYIFIKITADLSAAELFEKCLHKGIAIRVCSNYQGLDDSYFRVAVRTQAENDRLVETISSIFTPNGQRAGRRKKKSSLMIQGTSSNAGKSVLVAALCRILVQDGIRVAPYKAQNMSLNSFVTRDGLEMGRAQVVQAQAARLDPDVRMNPILLKPNSDVGSQIIVNGKPVGNMTVLEYVKYKNEIASKAHQSYDSLASEHEAIILEGAGSPGEVNLKHHDIVNMQMARYAEAPVLLVGDIDRGGVYASFIGTMEVLEEWERDLVAGFLVNRFRGDATLLGPAHDYLFNHTGKPVLATIPYLSNLGIPEEDSVSFKDGKLQKDKPEGEFVEIALINLPHISNFTDIEPFLDEPDVFLRIVNSAEELQTPQAIILPGSKNVIGDLEFLQQTGLAEKIVTLAGEGCEIVGICGGYQILGRKISDPFSIESENLTVSGLGLLPIETTLAQEKTLTRRTGRHIQSGAEVRGYEIHHGLSSGNCNPLLKFSDDSTCGMTHSEQPIWGAYLHGIFDADRFRRRFIDTLREKRGFAPLDRVVAPYDLERAFDRLAAVVRENMDMDRVYSLLDL